MSTFSTLGRFACFLPLATALCSAETFDLISRPAPPQGTDLLIRIDHPNPKQRSTEYPSIPFQPGDTVTIHAGGCVQSGGRGNTWHRYVDPSGGDADRLYHGLITIPFATESLARIQKYWNKSVHIADTAPPAKLHLQLGFEDDNYSDNGYYSHDNGPNNQCGAADGGPAWVELAIKHHGAVPTNTAASWDLILAQFDDNGIPLNPDWQSNVATKQFPDPAHCRWPWQSGAAPNCTNGGITNTDFDASYGFSFFKPLSMIRCASCSLCQTFSANYDFGGHANWTATTQTGTVFWEEKSSNDDEYSVNLKTPNAAGATAGRKDGIHVEFAYDETIDVLSDDMKIPWWQQFKGAVDGGDNQAHDFLDNRYLTVTWLMGLDFAHAPPGPESHPAWAMAIHANEDFSDDTWAFFVRNFGNEGYCSENQHYIAYPDSEYTFRFPWPSGATGGAIKSQFVRTNGTNAKQPQISFLPGQAVLLTFTGIPDGMNERVLIGGELHLSWGGTPTITRRVPVTMPVRTPPERGEEVINSAVAKMTPAQRTIYQANLPKVTRPVRPIANLTVQVVAPSNRTIRRKTQRPVVHAVRDEALVSNRNAHIQAVSKAYGGAIPAK